MLGVADSYGIELRQPLQEGRRTRQIGKKGKSNHRWVAGGKLCVVLNKLGMAADWDCNTANVHGKTFQPLLAHYDGHRNAGSATSAPWTARSVWTKAPSQKAELPATSDSPTWRRCQFKGLVRQLPPFAQNPGVLPARDKHK